MKRHWLVPVGLLVVATIGFTLVATAEPEAAPKTITVTFVSHGNVLKTEDQLLRKPHEAIRVSVDRGDRVVWRGVDIDRDEDIQDFTVWVEPLTGGPERPFYSGKDWAATQATHGKADAGPAVPAARGHVYKYHIKMKGKQPLDPHIIFD